MQNGTAVQEIATPYGLAMTVVVVTWSRFAGSAVLVPARSAKSLPPGGSCRQSALRNRLVTEEECGRECYYFGYVKASTEGSSLRRHWWRPVMLYRLSAFRPHSSSDPLARATFPPGEGIFSDAIRHRRAIQVSVGTPLLRCPRYQRAIPDTPGGVSLRNRCKKIPVRLDGDFQITWRTRQPWSRG